jgi:hypothetical protein
MTCNWVEKMHICIRKKKSIHGYTSIRSQSVILFKNSIIQFIYSKNKTTNQNTKKRPSIRYHSTVLIINKLRNELQTSVI